MDTDTKIDPAAVMAEMGLTVRSEFVPFSQSRNRNEVEDGRKLKLAGVDGKEGALVPMPRYSLNWRVTLIHNGRDVITTDYSAGIGHIPDYRTPRVYTVGHHEALVATVETGKNHFTPSGEPTSAFLGKRTELWPDAKDVVASLILDSDVIDFPTFEMWASELGYDADSRKAEATYRACLEIALKIRAAIGDAGMARLRDAFRDY